MSANPGKDFGPIADDYAFFERQSTEPDNDARSYARQLTGIAPSAGVVRMLDFGCGSGTFTARFLREVGWAAERVALTLVEPVDSARRAALSRLRDFTTAPIVESAT